MNAKQVLSKITSLLFTEEKQEVLFTEAKASNGDILSSPTFDLDESVEVVSEDGTKSPAPDGEYEVILKDESGNENIIRIEVKDGKISERENVEEAKNEEAPKEEEMAAEFPEAPKGLEKDEAKALPNTTDEDPRNRVGEDTDDKKDPIIALSYRIDELEKALTEMKEKFTSAYPQEGQEVSSLEPSPVAMAKEEEEELPKLDGAPIEEQKFSLSSKMNTKKTEGDYQNSFLSKLYK